jgi:hypothetical protein
MNKPIKSTEVTEPTNGGAEAISFSEPYRVRVKIEGSSDIIFHRWNPESVDEKAKGAKNSKSRKTDDVESYLWRDETGHICLPGEYLRQSIINAAKFKADPRSPRKSAMDITKAGVVSLTMYAPLNGGVKKWDYLDRRRVQIQRAGVNRTRPCFKAGWQAEFDFEVLLPEYIDRSMFYELLSMAGKLIGVADNRPSYGRFIITQFK